MDIDINDIMTRQDNEINRLQNEVKNLQQQLEVQKPHNSSKKGPHPVYANIEIINANEETEESKIPKKTDNNEQVLNIGKKRPYKYQFKLQPSTESVSLCSHRETVKVKYVLELPYTCDVCNKDFSHKANLNKHKNDHKGISNEIMTPQDYDEIRENLLLSKTSNVPEVYSCEKRDNIFNTKPALKEHTTTYHIEETQIHSKVQSCSHCEEDFNTTFSLGDHIDKVHMG